MRATISDGLFAPMYGHATHIHPHHTWRRGQHPGQPHKHHGDEDPHKSSTLARCNNSHTPSSSGSYTTGQSATSSSVDRPSKTVMEPYRSTTSQVRGSPPWSSRIACAKPPGALLTVPYRRPFGCSFTILTPPLPVRWPRSWYTPTTTDARWRT